MTYGERHDVSCTRSMRRSLNDGGDRNKRKRGIRAWGQWFPWRCFPCRQYSRRWSSNGLDAGQHQCGWARFHSERRATIGDRVSGQEFSYGRRKRVREISGVRDGLKRESICRNHCSIVDGAAGTTV